MRLAVHRGRAIVSFQDAGFRDVVTLTGGVYGPDLQNVFDNWEEACEVLAAAWTAASDDVFTPAVTDLDAAVGRPRQILAVGLNYADHVVETGLETPALPAVFTKFASSLAAPVADVSLPSAHVDWEIELVLTIGIGGRKLPVAQAWDHVAGVSVGQDFSDREAQFADSTPQFSLAKSHAGFGPVGPYVVTPDELDDRDSLTLVARVNGEVVQQASTSQLIRSVPVLLAQLSSVVELMPGDLIFTGTPAGVAYGRNPVAYLRAGDVVDSEIAGVGALTTTFFPLETLS